MMAAADLSPAVSAAALSAGLMTSVLGSWSDYRDNPDVTGSQTGAIRTAAAVGSTVVLALAAAGGGWPTLVVGAATVAVVAAAYGSAFAHTG